MAKIDNPTSNIPGQLTGLHLFHFDGAPCAQRVRFALGEKGLSRGREVRFDSTLPADIEGQSEQWVSRMVSLVKKDHMTEAYLAIHPNMVGPALVHDGQLYLESLDIISYLDDAFGGARLIPDNETKTEVLALTQEAKVLHRSIRFVTFHWGLGRLAMLNKKEREQLSQLAKQGADDENLVEFYDGYSTNTISEDIYIQHSVETHRVWLSPGGATS